MIEFKVKDRYKSDEYSFEVINITEDGKLVTVLWNEVPFQVEVPLLIELIEREGMKKVEDE